MTSGSHHSQRQQTQNCGTQHAWVDSGQRTVAEVPVARLLPMLWRLPWTREPRTAVAECEMGHPSSQTLHRVPHTLPSTSPYNWRTPLCPGRWTSKLCLASVCNIQRKRTLPKWNPPQGCGRAVSIQPLPSAPSAFPRTQEDLCVCLGDP